MLPPPNLRARHRGPQYGADLACGVDLNKVFHDQDVTTATRVQWMAKHLSAVFHVPARLAAFIARHHKYFKKWHKKYRESDSLLALRPFWFYDTWVTKDSRGLPLTRTLPYFSDPHDAERLRSGLPVPAYCCWNGLAVIDAGVFRSDGIRFRRHDHGECSGSECGLLCDDMWRMGRRRVVIDPSVRLVYTERDARQVYRPPFLDVGVAPWRPGLVSEMRAAWGALPAPELVQCCDLRDGNDMVLFDRDCRMYDWRAVNYTGWATSGRWRGADQF